MIQIRCKLHVTEINSAFEEIFVWFNHDHHFSLSSSSLLFFFSLHTRFVIMMLMIFVFTVINFLSIFAQYSHVSSLSLSSIVLFCELFLWIFYCFIKYCVLYLFAIPVLNFTCHWFSTWLCETSHWGSNSSRFTRIPKWIIFRVR